MSVGEACPSSGGGGGGRAGEERARPLSGVWALLARLRRGASSDSLSSAGSDATLSFAFLPPPPPAPLQADPPAPLDPAPLTDSYKRRVRERNARRHHDRDLTLHRKYGLFRGDAPTPFDALSLPHARRSLAEPLHSPQRDRRAASESLPRRAAHVPGKRRAPPPPRPHSLAATASLGRRPSRKRPAPQPPVQSLDRTTNWNIEKENIDALVKMKSNKSDRGKRPVSGDEASLSFKTEKNSKKDSNNKVPKMKREKSFLQQIFEGRKRNSAIEPPPERILPSISELDKQAAEIIETFRLKPVERDSRDRATPNRDAWFCTRCLRKYNSTVVTCLYCLPEHDNIRNGLVGDHFRNIANAYTQIDNDPSSGAASASRVNGLVTDDKQQLKVMLKEMKDSFAKRSKHESKDAESKAKSVREQKLDKNIELERICDNVRGRIEGESNKRDSYYDPVTLRIGSVANEGQGHSDQPSSSKQNAISSQSKEPVFKREFRLVNVKTEPVKETAVVTQPVVLVAPLPKNHGNTSNQITKNADKYAKSNQNVSKVLPSSSANPKKVTQPEKSESGIANTQEPFLLSSLLNPIYIPQETNAQDRRRLFFSQPEARSSESNSDSSSTAGPKEKLSSTTVTKAPATSSTSVEPKIAKESTKPLREPSPAPLVNITKPKTSSQTAVARPLSTLFTNVSTSTANTPLPENSKVSNANMVKMSVDQHSKRREWVNQLEQSIANGDETSAAQAAAKLAQLRVACSVLSFSSQIVGETSKNVTQSNVPKGQNVMPNETRVRATPFEPYQSKTKVNAAVQSMEVVSPKGNLRNSPNKEDATPWRTNQESNLLQSSSKPEASVLKGAANNANPVPSTSGQIASGSGSALVSINVWVEDREATRGPVRLSVPRLAALGELRRRASAALGLAGGLQRWIVGRTLCADDDTPLASLAGPELAAPFYLCLVEDTKGESRPQLKTKPSPNNDNPQRASDMTGDVYSELVQLEQRALVPNAETFDCGVCMEQCAIGAGAVLRECVHAFCRGCLSDLVRHCAEPAVACPALGCPGTLQEREIRAVTAPEEYERWLARGLAAAESGTRNAFHCRTRDCAGWALCEPGVRRFPCPVCKRTNCVLCQAIHEGETCEQHRTRLQTAATSLGGGDTDAGTRALLEDLIAKGEALECPECSAVITKKWGCDWVKCSACKTEICWVTRGRRWGPAGRGDTSAGCRCGVNGQRCHPSCGYCH